MKYIKVAVPDDFDPNDTSKLELRLHNWETDYEMSADIWQPVYRPVLDHGSIGLIDFMGDDQSIVEAARVSYGVGTKKISADEGLLRYLFRHRHTTPFEMVEFLFRVEAPILVFRQWQRHRTANINEYSARYSELSSVYYVPETEHIAPQSANNKQGRDGALSEHNAMAVQEAIRKACDDAFQTYAYLLGKIKTPSEGMELRRLTVEDEAMRAIAKRRKENPDLEISIQEVEDIILRHYEASGLFLADDEFREHGGIARELARMVTPMNTYSKMMWKCDLKNILHFIGLRSDSHAQYEIRAYSDAMLELIRPFVPWTIKAFLDYQMNGVSFSAQEMAILKDIVKEHRGLDTDLTRDILKQNGASAREVREFLAKFE